MTQPTRPTRPRRRGKRAADPARLAAYALLRDVHERGAYANLRLPALLRERGITGRDAAFATELAFGSLRWQLQYDTIVARNVDRPLADVDADVLDVLRLGAHQLLRMRTPAHAAVATTVDVARAIGGDGRARFANAVLRRIGERTVEEWLEVVAPDRAADPLGRLAIEHSHPRWIVSALQDAAGYHARPSAAIGALLDASNAPPRVTLAARPGRIARAALLAQSGADAVATPYATSGVRLGSGDPAAIPAMRDGRAQVQDEGSQLVTWAAVLAPVDGRDAWWLDMTAGPGGKAALLAGVAAERGARVLASELHPHRSALVRDALAGWPNALAITADGRAPAWRDGAFDRVLLDAPCSGLGALRRRPDARWRHQPSDLPALTRLQAELLGNAIDAVRPGGLVAYVTCSPHLAETTQLTSRVLGRRRDADLIDARPYVPGVPGLGDRPDVQLWPDVHGTDAMYLALIRRRPAVAT